MSKDFKLLFLGDVVGRPGREIAKEFLENIKNENEFDFVVVNAENASHGFGLTQKNHDEFFEMGVNCLTSGNHIWDKKDIFSHQIPLPNHLEKQILPPTRWQEYHLLQ